MIFVVDELFVWFDSVDGSLIKKDSLKGCICLVKIRYFLCWKYEWNFFFLCKCIENDLWNNFDGLFDEIWLENGG